MDQNQLTTLVTTQIPQMQMCVDNSSQVGAQEVFATNSLVENFVDSMRLVHKQGQQQQMREDLQENERRRASMDQRKDDWFDVAQSKVDRNILEAEKFKAIIAKPGEQLIMEQ